MVVLLLAGVFLLQVALPLGLWLARDRLTFFPEEGPTPEQGLRWMGPDVRADLVHVVRPDGRRLAAYDVSPLPSGSDPSSTEDGPVVLFLHGNAGNISSRAPTLARFVTECGVRTLLPDYSGFGGNEGSPSEEELRIDGLAAYDHLRAGGVEARRIVLYGESIGGAVALQVAAEREVAGVVTQSTFSSLSSMVRRLYGFFPLAVWLARDSFPNATRVAALRAPLLVVHGEADTIVPVEEGRRLTAAAAGAEFLPVAGADHNDLFEVGGRAYLRALGQRFRSWTAR